MATPVYESVYESVYEAGPQSGQHPGGARWETLALRFLKKRGLTLQQQNYRCPVGEIDLVMMDGKTLVFVEVRYRRSGTFGGGVESVDSRKQFRLAKVASHFLQRHSAFSRTPCRFDVVAISGTTDDPGINWIAHAFEDPRG